MELASQVIQVASLQVELDLSPLESWVSGKIGVRHLCDDIVDHVGIVNALVIHEIHGFRCVGLGLRGCDFFKIAS